MTTFNFLLLRGHFSILFDMQVNQAIEANMVRPELPEEADRVEQLMVEFRHVPHTYVDDREVLLWSRIRKILEYDRMTF
jgi:hypothetical protein